MSAPRFEPGSFMTEREGSTNWAINHWHVYKEWLFNGTRYLSVRSFPAENVQFAAFKNLRKSFVYTPFLFYYKTRLVSSMDFSPKSGLILLIFLHDNRLCISTASEKQLIINFPFFWQGKLYYSFVVMYEMLS
jgi:hypothetical protein